MTYALPPNDIEAERQCLGALLLAPDLVDRVTERVRPDEFYRPAHGKIFSAILAQREAGEPIDPQLVGDRLRRTHEIGSIGNLAYLADLISGTITVANAEYHADIVSRMAAYRRLIRAGTHIVELGGSADRDLDDARQSARLAVDWAVADRTPSEIVWAAEGINETLSSLESPAELYPTPWADVNNLLGGFAPGRLYTIGARPGVGKSAMVIQIAANHAEKTGQAVVVLMLEMSRQEVDLRLISQMARVDYGRLERRHLTDADWQRIANAQGRIGELPLTVIDRSNMTIASIRRDARSIARMTRLGMLVVDYLQLMSATGEDRRRPRHEIVADYSRSLKLLSRELHVPVIAVSQLNRASEGRAGKKPGLHDLRESGSVEQDSDAVLLLHRNLTEPSEINELTVSLAKHRQGPTGDVGLVFDGQHQRVVQHAWSPSSVLDTMKVDPDAETVNMQK